MFYENLNNEAGGEFASEDRDLLKIATQIDCLFGRSKHGGPLFMAMSRVYPDLAAFIRDKRNRHDVSWLSRKLTNAEGKLFIDCLMPEVSDSGIPCLPFHDGFSVPESTGERVRSLCQRLTSEQLGFAPKFGIKNHAVC